MILQTCGGSSAHQNKKKQFLSMYVHTFSSRGATSSFSQRQSCKFLSMGTLESVVYSSLIQHEDTIPIHSWYSTCQTIVTAPGPVTGCVGR